MKRPSVLLVAVLVLLASALPVAMSASYAVASLGTRYGVPWAWLASTALAGLFAGALRAHRRRRAGVTLIQVALFVGLVGIGLAVMIPAFVRAVRFSKVAETSEHLGTMFRGTAAYYARVHPRGDGTRVHCIPPAAGPTPAEPPTDTVVVDFQGPDVNGAATWSAIGFTPEAPIRYRYTFAPAATGCDRRDAVAANAPSITMRAEGDLDADGEYSLFERTAEARDGELLPGRVAVALDRTE
jgi:hypothetical protein